MSFFSLARRLAVTGITGGGEVGALLYKTQRLRQEMRVAIVSDIHGNLTAFEAVLADLRRNAPDLILHGGDLADAGASPVEIVDRIRELGWAGVLGNTDEMLCRPESLREFAGQSPAMLPLVPVIEKMAAATRDRLGEDRLQWLSSLPRIQHAEGIALVHASPETAWRAPGRDASDDELRSVYGGLGASIVVYGHIHQPSIRHMKELTVVNAGSVSLSYDGDTRASYFLLDDEVVQIRRVAYDITKEVKALSDRDMPHWQWIAKILQSGRPQMPE